MPQADSEPPGAEQADLLGRDPVVALGPPAVESSAYVVDPAAASLGHSALSEGDPTSNLGDAEAAPGPAVAERTDEANDKVPNAERSTGEHAKETAANAEVPDAARFREKMRRVSFVWNRLLGNDDVEPEFITLFTSFVLDDLLPGYRNGIQDTRMQNVVTQKIKEFALYLDGFTAVEIIEQLKLEGKTPANLRARRMNLLAAVIKKYGKEGVEIKWSDYVQRMAAQLPAGELPRWRQSVPKSSRPGAAEVSSATTSSGEEAGLKPKQKSLTPPPESRTAVLPVAIVLGDRLRVRELADGDVTELAKHLCGREVDVASASFGRAAADLRRILRDVALRARLEPGRTDITERELMLLRHLVGDETGKIPPKTLRQILRNSKSQGRNRDLTIEHLRREVVTALKKLPVRR